MSDDCAQLWQKSIEDIDQSGLLDPGPLSEEMEEMDSEYVGQACEEVESDDIYVCRVFRDGDEAYNAYDAYALAKGFGIRKGKTSKSRTDQTIIRRQYLCNKDGRKRVDKRSEGHDIQFLRDTRCDCPAKIEVVLNDMSEWVLVKFIAEHNHPLSITPSKSKTIMRFVHWFTVSTVRVLGRPILQEFVTLPGPIPNKILPNSNVSRSLDRKREIMLVESAWAL